MRTLVVLVLSSLLAACATQAPAPPQSEPAVAPPAPPAADTPKPAPLFEKLGNFSRSISTQNAQAQRYFNQGLVLTYGFNHAEARRSYEAALKLDPNCAICAWGAALVLGPNINLPMMEPVNADAVALAQKARELVANASPVENALIDALAKRYQAQWVADRSALDRAYADAMRAVAQQYPNDADVQALFAESLLDLFPWNYWQNDGTPRPETDEALAALRRAVAVQPKHPGALHYLIHALEEYRPKEAEAHADALRDLVPDAGHLVHMPAHIYLRLGRYADSLQANIAAGEADSSYIEQCQVQGFYPLAYHPHNWHFVAVSAVFLGNRAQAMNAARRTGHLMHDQKHDDPAVGLVVQHFDMMPWVTAARLGLWDDVLAMPAPAQGGAYAAALAHFARGLALSAKGDANSAQAELTALRKIAARPELKEAYVSVRNTAAGILAVAEHFLAGELHLRAKQHAAAIAALRQAVVAEDALGYNEPEDWNYPARLLLGAALLEARQPAAAEKAFREDLAKHPNNGWALYGLAQSLEARGQKAAAATTRKQFDSAWSEADITLTAAVIR